MDKLILLSGFVSDTSFRAVAIAPDGGPMRIATRGGFAPVSGTINTEALPLPLGFVELFGPAQATKITITGLVPGEAHRLRVTTDDGGLMSEVDFRTLAPEAAELKVVVASCYYDGFHRAQKYLDLLRSPYCRDAAFKLLVGDNLYVDVHESQRMSGQGGAFEQTTRIYGQYFMESVYRDVLATLPTMTTWDDHEFWNNYPEEVKWLSRTKTESRRNRYTQAALQNLELFQASLNPASIIAGQGEYSFEIDGTPLVDFLVLDTRTQRRPIRSDVVQTMTPASLARLKTWSAALERPGVLVLGQPLWIDEGSRKIDLNPPNYETEYAAIWAAIASAPWDILIVSGDVHHSRLLEIELGGTARAYEFVSSPAVHIPTETAVATGGYREGAQARAQPEFPKLIKNEVFPGGLRARYLTGTDANNSIGTLTFRRAAAEAVSVDMAFLDMLEPSHVARATKANVGFFGGGTHPSFSEERCARSRAFTLRKR